MRVGLLGGGVIARLFLEHARAGDMVGAEVVAIAAATKSPGQAPRARVRVPLCWSRQADRRPPRGRHRSRLHDAVRDHAEALLSNGSPSSCSRAERCGRALRARLERAAEKHRALLCLPSAESAAGRAQGRVRGGVDE